jgi:3-oxoacyl-[acyl-carrier-protein] synthase II
MADRTVVVTGMAVRSAYGAGTDPLLAGAYGGLPAFAPVDRFGTEQCRTTVAATLPGAPVLAAELEAVVEEACADARLPRLGVGRVRSGSPLLLAAHAGRDITAVATSVAAATGLSTPDRVYTAACVAASSAVADAAAGIAAGRVDRVVVAAGFLVDAGTFGLFDSGRALARDGSVRPFSAGRQGILLGDGVAAVVLEAAGSTRGVPALATLAGWGRAGDAYHVCQPRPDGTGLARAATAALTRAGLPAGEVGYVNANGTGTPAADAAESAALRLLFGDGLDQVPVSSTKSVHGHALEASALLELVVTVLALRDGRLPVNAGFLAADADCPLDLVLDEPRPANPRHALSLNAAFGGANTALLVGAA